MTAQQLVGLAIRIAALFILILETRGLLWWGSVIRENKDRFPEGMDLTFLIGTMAVLILCVFCATFPMLFARLLIPKANADYQVSSYTFQDIEIFGLTLLGLYILSDGIPDAVYYAFQYSYASSARVTYFTGPTISEMASCATQILIGFGLIFGRRGVRNIWKKFRNAGWEPDPPTSSN